MLSLYNRPLIDYHLLRLRSLDEFNPATAKEFPSQKYFLSDKHAWNSATVDEAPFAENI